MSQQEKSLPIDGDASAQALIYHAVPSERVVKALEADTHLGLSESGVRSRLEKYGPNRLKPPTRPSLLKIIFRQFANALTIILLAAMAVSFGTQDWISGGVIAALILLNVVVGTVTEWEAEKTVASLESVGAPQATVLRHADGNSQPYVKIIAVEDVVPGDIIVVRNGDVIPADARILDSEISDLECDEALLTGESLPVAKQSDPIDEKDCPVGDRICLVFSGSLVTKGRARCIVFGTGMSTEIGRIADALSKKAERSGTGFQAKWYKVKRWLGVVETSPLQIMLNKLAYALLIAAILTAIIVLSTTGYRDIPLSIATYAVAAAVSVLPASLIAVISLVLARASTELAKSNALVRRMDAVEALAGVENVCSDKTGTLTVGRMTVRKAWVPSQEDLEAGTTYSFDSASHPFEPKGEVYTNPSESETRNIVDTANLPESLSAFAFCAGLCNQAVLASGPNETGHWEANGDPTEVALQVSAHKLGRGKPSLVRPSPEQPVGRFEHTIEHPFDSTVKRMSIAYLFHPGQSEQSGYIACYLKGAVERVLDACVSVGGKPLTVERRELILATMDTMAGEGLRVLGLCGRRVNVEEQHHLKHLSRAEFEQGFDFLGLAGIFDPPRPESAAAVAECYQAGIVPRMLTGDHPATATAIALSIGIIQPGYAKSSVMTGQQFDALSNDEVDALPDLPLVVARCAPETKVRMVDAIHRRGQHTVMTGDGVNDAPSLKRADVGVGMGTGSDVAKQSSNLVLADDNFATICKAIRKGRGVFKNLVKFLMYLLSGNLAQITIMMIGLAFRDDNAQAVYPISPVGALWIITMSAGPPALALGLEPTPADAMDLPPTEFHSIFTAEFYIDMFFYGFIMAVTSLVNFVIVLWGYYPGDLGRECNDDIGGCDAVFKARATCFATFIIVLMIHALECKHANLGLFQMKLNDNKTLLWFCVFATVLTFPTVHIPVINDKVFKIGALTWEWGIVFGMIFVYTGATEMYKWCKRAYFRQHRGEASGPAW